VIFMSKRILVIAGLSLALVGTVALGVYRAKAQGFENGRDDLIQKLAQKFGLNEADVQAVFEQDRQERQQQMETNFEERLNQAVADGQLTEEQKNLILEKHRQIKDQREQNQGNWQNLTQEQKHQKNQEQRQELQDWATQNNIDLTWLIRKGGH